MSAATYAKYAEKFTQRLPGYAAVLMRSLRFSLRPLRVIDFLFLFLQTL